MAKRKLAENPKRQLDSFLAKYDPAIVAFARQVLVKMRQRLPGAVQMVYDNYNALMIGFGPNDRPSLAIFSIVLGDFVVEIAVGRDLGDVYAGERVTHAIMGILYGAMLATPAPTLISWWASPTALNIALVPIPKWVRVALSAMGVGVVLSGLRDLYAALQLPGGGWPWRLGDVETRNRWPGKP